MQQWEANSWAKICLQTKDAQDLVQMEAAAKTNSLCAFILSHQDKPSVLVVGPDVRTQIDKVTGKLRLL